MSIPTLVAGLLTVVETMNNLIKTREEKIALKQESNLLARQQIDKLGNTYNQGVNNIYAQAITSGLSLSSNAVLGQINNLNKVNDEAMQQIEQNRDARNQSIMKTNNSNKILRDSIVDSILTYTKTKTSNNLYSLADYYLAKQLTDDDSTSNETNSQTTY